MAGRGVSHITNRINDCRSLRRVELNLRLTRRPHLRGTRANTASEHEHDRSVQKTVVHGVLLLLARNGRELPQRCGRSRPTPQERDQNLVTKWRVSTAQREQELQHPIDARPADAERLSNFTHARSQTILAPL